MASEATQTKQLAGRARSQISMLVAQFLVGMGVNLIGDTPGAIAHTTKGVLLALHVLITIGLVVGAIQIVSLTRDLPTFSRLARGGGASIGLALLGGILNMWLKNDWWSFLMAIGFIAAVVFFGLLYVKSHVVAATNRSGK